MDEIKEFKGKCDYIMVNQVIHHLDAGQGSYPNFKVAMKKMAGFLKPGGKFIMNHLLNETMEATWQYTIHPKASAKHFIRFAPR